MGFSGASSSDVFEFPENMQFDKLPPFLRVLLTTDGTVTKSLESYFLERVSVEPVEQSYIVLSEDMASLDCIEGMTVVSRQVRLCGATSGKLYAKAMSFIRYDLLPEHFQHDLNKQTLGVGELLRECGLETYREILAVGQDHSAGEVWRSYRIVMGQRPFIHIKEHFPLVPYRV